jgi:membrane-associated phospholipid phosphatase
VMLWIIIFLVIAVLNRGKIKSMLFSFPFALVINKILIELVFRRIVTRPRPYLVLEDIEYIGPLLTDFSFPSAHVTATTALVYLAVFYEAGFLGPGIVFVLLMCFSRMYNGVHWPLDTVGGIIIGIFIGWISLKLTEIVLVKLQRSRIKQIQKSDDDKTDYIIPIHPLEDRRK